MDMKTDRTSSSSRRYTSFFLSIAAILVVVSGLLPQSMYAQSSEAASSSVPRITTKIDDSKLTTLHGNTPPFAQAKYDKGAVAPSTPVDRMLLVLKRSPAQEADLKQLMSDQHNKKSANYHKWLTPAQFAKRFGPADSDIEAVNGWLQKHGFTVNKTSAGHGVIDFSGTAGQLKSTFHTELHNYTRNGVSFYSNNKDPQIPEALKPVVGGFASLNNFKPKSFTTVLGKAAFTAKTHQTKPLWSYPADNEGDVYLAVAPGDFAVQYDINPVYSAGNTGSGETIGIISASNVDNAIVGNYRSLFGLSSSVPSVIVDGNDPGQNGAATEAYLDVEASGSVAPGAQVNLYVGADTNTTSGLYMAMIRAVDDNVADVISLSYGTCEQFLGSSGNEFFEAVWGQAAAQGQTVFVSAGDGGSAGCDDFDYEEQATLGLAVSGFASTPYNVAVGGTDFYYTSAGAVSNYWDLTGTNTPNTSILGVVPEQPWNNAFGLNVGEDVNPDTIVAGSGGASSCATGVDDPNTGEYSSCTAGYPKPSWQVGAGVPNDGVRDIPDVSLFAANGANFSFWPICTATTDCQAALYTGSDCENVPAGDGAVCITGVGGTSASSPAMAGIMALVDAAESGRQGNANFELYPIAASAPNSFNDVTVGSNNVPCVAGSPDCSLDGSDSYYSLQNYYATPGYDLASGLGSVNVANLISNWGSVSFAGTDTSLSLSETTFTHGTPITVTAAVTSDAGTPTGPLALVTTSTLPGQIGLGAATLANDGTVNSTVNFFPGGTYTVSAQYGGDGTFGASTSAPVTVTVSAENSASLLSGTYYDPNYNFFPVTNGMTAQYGSYYYFDTQVYSSAGSPSTNDGFPTGNVTYKDGGSTLGTVNLNSNGVAEWATGTLGIGTHKISSSFAGDASFGPSTSSQLKISVVAGTPYLYLEDYFTTPDGIVAGQPFVVPVLVESVGGVAPTGTVAVTFNGVTQTATLASSNYYGTALATGTVTFTNTDAGTYTLSATYSGDGNFTSAVATPQTVVASGNALLASTTTLTTSANNVGADGAIRMNASVGGNGTITPTGLVYLLLNGLAFFGAELDSTGNAALLVPGADILSGTNQITAQYFGDANYNGSISAPVTVTGNSGDFSLTTSNPVLVIPTGTTGSTNISVGSSTGMTGTVNLSCAVSDPSLTCTIQNANLALPSDSSQYATTQIIINTVKQNIPSKVGTTKPVANNSKRGHLAGWLAGGSGLTLAVLFLGFPARRRTWGTLFCLVLMAGIGFGSVGCGGSVAPLPPPTYTDATPGQYGLTITATGPTAGGGELAVTHTLVLQVVVTGGAQ